jgi:hypothetical protein
MILTISKLRSLNAYKTTADLTNSQNKTQDNVVRTPTDTDTMSRLFANTYS